MKTALFLVALCIACAFAADLGEFKCGSGEQENVSCSRDCCVKSGGIYNFQENQCVVARASDWGLVIQCANSAPCCEKIPGSADSGGCPLAIASLLVAGTLAAKAGGRI
jgi:hypothetical protein